VASRSSFPLIRGRKMRVTRLDGCGNPLYGLGSQVVTEGFVSVAVTSQVTEAEPIEVTNAGGKVCARDPGSADWNGYALEITFCDVQPCLFEMLTGQPPVVDAQGSIVGFKMNSGVDASAQAFALEVWAGVPGVACGSSGGGGSFGYILFPYVSSGVIGDFTIENAALNFVITGAQTKDGNSWGAGPYEVAPDAAGDPAVLPELLDDDDHLYVIWTPIAPPDVTDGCVELVEPPPIPLTGVTAGMPGSFQPANAVPPADLAALKADPVVGDAGSAMPGPAWGGGEWVQLGDGSHAHWDGTMWVAGDAPAVARRLKI
jgi:hypothetical protein